MGWPEAGLGTTGLLASQTSVVLMMEAGFVGAACSEATLVQLKGQLNNGLLWTHHSNSVFSGVRSLKVGGYPGPLLTGAAASLLCTCLIRTVVFLIRLVKCQELDGNATSGRRFQCMY